MNNTETEKQHFDAISRQRRANGFVPDLERMTACDFFYLSPFRRRELANLMLGRWSRFRLQHLKEHLGTGARILDLGCGSGWFSLELARAGFDVTGVDLSSESVELARETLAGARLPATAGRVTYEVADLNEWTPTDRDFDAVCYVGVLHHLENPGAVVARIKKALRLGHFMAADDPMSENNGPVEAAVALLVRGLLSASGSWYRERPLPRSASEVDAALEEVRLEYVNWADSTEVRQSPMNNSSNGAANLRVLEQHYTITARLDYPPLAHRLIGGIRLGSDDENLKCAEFITLIEEVLLRYGAVKPGGYLVFGQAK